jgi:hypothetical protein
MCMYIYVYVYIYVYTYIYILLLACRTFSNSFGWYYIQLSPTQGRLGWYRTLLAILRTHPG